MPAGLRRVGGRNESTERVTQSVTVFASRLRVHHMAPKRRHRQRDSRSGKACLQKTLGSVSGGENASLQKVANAPGVSR